MPPLPFQSRDNSDPRRKKLLENEQLKIISECSDKLVDLSLRNEKEEKERKQQRLMQEKKDHTKKKQLDKASDNKQQIADKQVFNYSVKKQKKHK